MKRACSPEHDTESTRSFDDACPLNAASCTSNRYAIQVKGSIVIKIPEDWEKGYYYSAGARDAPSSGMEPPPTYQYEKIDDWATKNALYSSIISSSLSNSIISELFEQSGTTSQLEDECRISFSHPVCFADFDDSGIVGNRRQSVLGASQMFSEAKPSNMFSGIHVSECFTV